ncbi:hypothetical protein PAXINDRAFT_102436 [Paxillus involutus ATCC 200175]|uniref:Unplaced genomic scaffold PAXINscaffold_228, whole genome shotgun sequence n=1 Tax=Paxillus involutus ATCC 200175 TaxID=664439 RepID=A0A0C9SZQ4_PAXIN|nr:hypothetical protein PAXINDRAFT_102436 [Paxillus involutus ATCC 200175]
MCMKRPTDPLQVLAPELVGEIFYLRLLDSIYPYTNNSYSQLPVLLSLVSKSWRDFVYASPFLWAHIITDTSQGSVASLHALRKRLERSQSAPLFLDVDVGEQPDRDALGVLFAERSRFRQLTLRVIDLSWWDRISMEGFTELKKLTLHTGTQVPTHVNKLSTIFSSAPSLCSVNWHSTGELGPVGVQGHQLRFLDLTVFRIPVTHVLEVLVVCPNLLDAAIRFQDAHGYIPMPFRGRILLPELRSLILHGTRHLTCILRGVQAPLLSRLEIHWHDSTGREFGLEALQSLLAYSPHLEDIVLRDFLITEDGLFSIITTTNKHLLRLTVAAAPGQTKLITQRTFDVLTRQEQGNYTLPLLEELEFRGGLDVPDKVLLRMIESRTSLPDGMGFRSHARTLKSICLDDCKPMAEASIFRVESICRKRGLKAKGTFISRNQVSASTVATGVRTFATVTGISSGSVNEFLGIPFAQSPTGNLRFQLPQALLPYNASFSAITYGPACPQQAIRFLIMSGLPAETLDYLTKTIYSVVTPSAEDCLTLNVVALAGATPDSKIPIVAWIYGDGFEAGGTSQYDGSIIVEKAISLGVPAIYVSMNYRLNAFGFLASQEVEDAGVGNLGLQDQRLALYWVQKYIGAFGGDPTEVTIWGESSGAISVALQTVTNGGDPDGLFRAAFIQIGSPIPVGDITHGQRYYDASGWDWLSCCVQYAAVSAGPVRDVARCGESVPERIFVSAWMPRVDGVFLTDDPQYLVQQGSVADVPFVTGNCDVEGTLFSFSTLNITTDAQLEEYLRTYWLPDAPLTTKQELMEYYPADITQGSPFDTDTLNALTPRFKRIAAFQGDAVFQAPRRFFLQNRSGKQPLDICKRLKAVPFLGSFHGSDILNVYGGHDMASYLVRFVSNLDIGRNTQLRSRTCWNFSMG